MIICLPIDVAALLLLHSEDLLKQFQFHAAALYYMIVLHVVLDKGAQGDDDGTVR